MQLDSVDTRQLNNIKAHKHALDLYVSTSAEVFLKSTIVQLQEWKLLCDMKLVVYSISTAMSSACTIIRQD